MSIEAMKQALEALESCDEGDWSTGHVIHPSYNEKSVEHAITALRQAIEQSTEQEPVAAQCKFDAEKTWGWCLVEHHNLVQSEPEKWPQYNTRLLYTQPQEAAPRKPLTDDEIWKDDGIMAANSGYGATFEALRVVVRAIEAAHGITGEKE